VEEVRGVPRGPFEDLEVIRVEHGMPATRFTELVRIPLRTYRRWRARARAGALVKGPWPAPVRQGSLRRDRGPGGRAYGVGASEGAGDGPPRGL